MYRYTSLWVIAALMRSILQAHAGQPSTSAPPPPQPQQSPASPDPATPTTSPTNTPPSSGNATPADTSTTPQPGFLSTPTGQATAAIGGLATLGVGAVAAKKGFEAGVKNYKGRKVQQEQELDQRLREKETNKQKQQEAAKEQEKLQAQAAAKKQEKHIAWLAEEQGRLVKAAEAEAQEKLQKEEVAKEQEKEKLQKEIDKLLPLSPHHSAPHPVPSETKDQKKQKQEKQEKKEKQEKQGRLVKAAEAEAQEKLQKKHIAWLVKENIYPSKQHLENLDLSKNPDVTKAQEARRQLLWHLGQDVFYYDHFKKPENLVAAKNYAQTLVEKIHSSDSTTHNHLKKIIEHLNQRAETHTAHPLPPKSE